MLVPGQVIITTAVFAIIITAPLGAILINTLGEKWLTVDDEQTPCANAVHPSHKFESTKTLAEYDSNKTLHSPGIGPNEKTPAPETEQYLHDSIIEHDIEDFKLKEFKEDQSKSLEIEKQDTAR